MSTSRQLRLAARPHGEIKDTDFELVEAPVPEAGGGELVVEMTHISIDPAMRGWMNAGRSYVPPVELGEVMRALALGRVVASRNEHFSAGDVVHGAFGVQMAGWLREGRLSSVEDTVRGGIDAFPDTLRHLFAGEKTGKLVLELG